MNILLNKLPRTYERLKNTVTLTDVGSVQFNTSLAKFTCILAAADALQLLTITVTFCSHNVKVKSVRIVRKCHLNEHNL